jgi:hypothetical protein
MTTAIDQEVITRGEQNSKAFLDMEDQVHELHRFTAIAHDYVIRLFHELDEVRKEELRPCLLR